MNGTDSYIPVARIADMLLSPGAAYDYDGQRRRYPDIIRNTLTSQQAQAAWSTPDISGWMDRSRLNAVRGIGDHATDPRMQASLHRLLTSMTPALENLAQLAEISRPVAATAGT